jgi:hypothetical protein
MELLWAKAEMESARNNLRQTRHLARQIFKMEILQLILEG